MALIAGVAGVGVLYMLTNAAVQYVLPVSAVAASQHPASDAMRVAVGAGGAALVSAGIAISMLVTLNGTVMSGARVPYAVARDGYLFPALAEVHPVFRTPAVAIVVQCALAVAAPGNLGKISRAVFTGDLCGMALLHGRSQHAFRLSQTQSGSRATVQDLGISGGSGGVCAGFGGAAVLLVHG